MFPDISKNGSEAVWACDFAPDGKVIASGGDDNKIILWDPKKGERLTELKGHRLAKFFFFGLPHSPRSPGERRREVN